MFAAYWLERWHEGRIGWHYGKPLPLLMKHWAALEIPPRTKVLVPLCGKSADLLWLAAQECLVLGVELSPLAVEQLFAENHLTPRSRQEPDGVHWTAGSLEIINGDIFDVDAATLDGCGAFYDRAALIALPAPMRERYVHEIYGKLPGGCRGLLITLGYPPGEMDGPPFAVDDAEVHRLFDAGWQVDLLEREDILDAQPSFAAQGVTALHNAVYRLVKRID